MKVVVRSALNILLSIKIHPYIVAVPPPIFIHIIIIIIQNTIKINHTTVEVTQALDITKIPILIIIHLSR
eukprot:UN25952